MPTGFHSDVVGAALAEARWGAGRGLADLAYVTVGTGVGAGMIAHGRPVDGLTHSEFGHIRVPRLPGDESGRRLPLPRRLRRRAGRRSGDGGTHGDEGQGPCPDHPAWDAVGVGARRPVRHADGFTGVPRRIVLGGGVLVGNEPLLARLCTLTAASLGGYVALPEVEDMETYLVPAALGGRGRSVPWCWGRRRWRRRADRSCRGGRRGRSSPNV
ncbi:ROK family protein [Sphingomonas sp. MMS24-JH45]